MDHLWGSIHVLSQDSLASLSRPEAGCAKASQVGKMKKCQYIIDLTIYNTIFYVYNIINYMQSYVSFICQWFLNPFSKTDQRRAAGAGRLPCEPYGRSCPPWNTRNQAKNLYKIFKIFQNVCFNCFYMTSISAICSELVNMVKQKTSLSTHEPSWSE